MEITRLDEKAYLNEIVAYWLQFEGYTYDWLINKLVEKPIIVSQKFSLVEVVTTTMSFQNALVITTTKEPKPIKDK
jgi:hypothetical protein